MNLEIELPAAELIQSPSHRAASEAFGLDQLTLAGAIRQNATLTLKVTAEQFGVFVALRNSYGGTNRVAALKPRLIINPIKTKLDVTQYRLAA